MAEEIIPTAEEDITNSEVIEEEDKAQENFSREEVLKLIKSESDKRVSKALATQQKKYEKQMSLSKLDGDERDKAEKDNKIIELQEQLDLFKIEKNRSELKSVLSTRGLSAEFADIITISDDIEASQANIDKLDKLFKAAVKAEVEKRLVGNAPKGNNPNSATMTKETFTALPIAKQSELLKTNPTFYAQFLK